MNINHRRALFLPDLLSCARSGRCDYHTSMFGSQGNAKNAPKEWFSLASQTLRAKVGTECWRKIKELDEREQQSRDARITIPRPRCERLGFLHQLSRDFPTLAPCAGCKKLVSYDAPHGWSNLEYEEEAAGFLAQKILRRGIGLDSTMHDERHICTVLLACAGTYPRRWLGDVRGAMLNAEFPPEAPDGNLEMRFSVHVTIESSERLVYWSRIHMDLPRPWSKLTVEAQIAVTFGMRVCQHTVWKTAGTLDMRSSWEDVCFDCPSRGVVKIVDRDQIRIDDFRVSTRECNSKFQVVVDIQEIALDHRDDIW
ncbi:hypothetical protein B0J11DRAFT_503934 [Dendryphion nanum]|uniref:Uncharacterized protein n=1 Tax=Dendryphion nanum TaxID=256645 RepID=A0A9P9E3M6_9PLEO|nr:hypothetical protein B0J11DRAFT_503934 [Dendryphion nanum]